MRLDFKNDPHIRLLIEEGLKEDIGSGDHSSLSCIPEDALGAAILKVKSNGILAGIELGKEVLWAVDKEIAIEQWKQDGEEVFAGALVFKASGKVRSLLAAERLMLNFIQRLSGIATVTKRYASQLEGTNTKLLDTRKTTPGLRTLEKWAVTVGGGNNHRIGLFDMIMLKDNHVDAAGGITNAIQKAQLYLKEKNLALGIEVETRNLQEVKEVLAIGGVQRIMLDNMNPELVKEATALIGGRFETEASGGITWDNIRSYALAGAQFISIGALTHSVKAMDLNFKISKA